MNTVYSMFEVRDRIHGFLFRIITPKIFVHDIMGESS